MVDIEIVLGRVKAKYEIYGEKMEKLFNFLLLNFPEGSLVIKENFKEDSPILLAFEEFKSIIG